jgi:3',5'-cyclic AMP phosphodiesterase CpdA
MLTLALGGSIAAHCSFAAPPPFEGGFTLAVLPDTQIYAWKYPEIYTAQTRWIADNVKTYNITYVLHVGDVTQHNTNEQWKIAQDAHALMSKKVPCAILPGNHDLGVGGKADSRESLMSEFFPLSEFKKWQTFGGVYDKEPARTENNFHLFEAGGRKWLVIALEFGPRDDVLRWANDVAAKYPDRSAILITHAYLRPDNTRFDRKVFTTVKGKRSNKGLDGSVLSKATSGFNDGEDIWEKVASQHANFALVISGHVCITGRRTDAGKHGNTVHQMVVDYQNQEKGGNGYLRLLQFLPDGKSIRVRDYSPVLDDTIKTEDRVYDLELPPAPRGKK